MQSQGQNTPTDEGLTRHHEIKQFFFFKENLLKIIFISQVFIKKN